jgi:CDP-diacylglycerol--glycerol-3-phosphate 3-phosphatidyltransferase
MRNAVAPRGAPAVTPSRNRVLRTVPNWLSLFRLICSPLIGALLLFDAHGLRVLIAILFTLASITDYLDGYLARRWSAVSALGVFMDLAADKLLVSTVLIILVGNGAVPSWMVAVIIGREFIVSGLRSYAAAKGMVISASQLGKWKTTVTLIAIIMTILEVNTNIDLWALGLATAITFVSGVDYVARYWQAELKG